MDPTTKDRTALEELEATLWRVETRFDPLFMNMIPAADFVELGRSGR